MALNPLTSEARQLRILKKMPLLQTVDEARWSTLLPHIRFREIDEGEPLFQAGRQSENLYMVLDGELGLYLPEKRQLDGDARFYLHSRHRGDTAGDFSVLNGGEHLVTAIAARRTRVACFPRYAFELLADMDPGILATVYDTAAELSRRVTLARVFLDMFGRLSTDCMNELLDDTRIEHYHSGNIVFEQGETTDGLRIVVSGRLQVESRGPDGTTLLVGEVRARESVGELGLISRAPRSATVYATRESTVAFLPEARFHELIDRRPHLLIPLTQMVVRRQYHLSRRQPGQTRDQNHVFIALDPRLPVRRLMQQLKRMLRREGQTPLLLDSRGFDTQYGKTGASQTTFDNVFNPAIAEWLDDKENRYSSILYVADGTLSPWTRRCLNRADRILLLASATADNDPAQRRIERELEALFHDSRVKPRIDLVLLHPSSTDRPRDTLRWLEARQVHAHFHVRIDDRRHVARLARSLCGRTRGLVLSGGGARGYAHLGVQRVIEEHQLDIDAIGGSSMGGLLGASMALGQHAADIEALSATFANKRALYDYTLPLTSLMKSDKLTRFCRTVYGDVRIEDLWIPYFCVSSNLTNGREVVHDRGELWRVIRATISLPGIFSPMPTAAGELLIDGAVLNTFPVDVMTERLGGSGFLIGVNVSQIAELQHYENFGPSLSGWRTLLQRLHPFTGRPRVPRIAETLLRSTDIKGMDRLADSKALLDVLVEPDVSAISLLDFKSYASISDIGYAEALRVFAQHGLVPYSVLHPVSTAVSSNDDAASDLSAAAMPQSS